MKTVNTVEFELFYTDYFCMRSTSYDKLLRAAISTLKNNDNMTGKYTIKRCGITIATIGIAIRTITVS